MATSAYRRVLIKLSGEGLAGEEGFGINPAVIGGIAEQIREVRAMEAEVSIVIGGGNIIRGMSAAKEGMDRANADYMGMLASVINATLSSVAALRTTVAASPRSAPTSRNDQKLTSSLVAASSASNCRTA
ncbi:MAG: hypothetical protein GY733_09845 [bacterium]|nr:hypothetical protein [bacterium]